MADRKPADSCRQALILEHERDAGAGLLAGWLEERGFRLAVVRPTEGDELPGAEGLDLLVILGSSQSVNDELDWIDAEINLVQAAHRIGIPLFGICFGGQLLARALGGRVLRNEATAVGWVEIESRRPEVITRGPWFEWHFDVFEPPADAELLATSTSGAEAFRIGRSLGVQFHPEVDRQIMDTWIAGDPEGLERGRTSGERLIAEMGTEPLVTRTNRLFEGIGREIGII